MRKKLISEKTIIVGYSEEARGILEELVKQFGDSGNLLGIIDNNVSKGSEIIGVPFLGKVVESESVIKDNKTESIVQIGHFEQSLNMITFCRANNISYRAIPLTLNIYSKNFIGENNGNLITLRLQATPLSGPKMYIKRLFDIVGSFIFAVILFPVFLIIFILLKLENLGAPVLIKEKRYSGFLGKTFNMFRFRTLPKGEREEIEKLSFEELTESLKKRKEDKRATKIGRFLRKTYLSELPQLINVFAGSMSLVGPRPPYEKEIEMYSDSLKKRLIVRPGMTGLWQVSRSGGFKFEDMFEQDSFYVENWSLSLDFSILLKTLIKILRYRR